MVVCVRGVFVLWSEFYVQSFLIFCSLNRYKLFLIFSDLLQIEWDFQWNKSADLTKSYLNKVHFFLVYMHL